MVSLTVPVETKKVPNSNSEKTIPFTDGDELRQNVAATFLQESGTTSFWPTTARLPYKNCMSRLNCFMILSRPSALIRHKE
jgi:hypothetical protein